MRKFLARHMSTLVLLAALIGVLGGGYLAGGLLGLGCCLIFDSLCAGVWALAWDDGVPAVGQIHGVPTLQQVLDRARGSG